MARIKVISACPLYDGMPVTFKAPCDCTKADGLRVHYEETSQTFDFVDAHGNNLAGVGNLFAEGAYVKVILNTEESKAYIQNADTNAYLESRLKSAGGGDVSKAYVDAELEKKLDKTGGTMISKDEERETTLAPEKISLENADSSTNEITATGIQLSEDGEEGKLITKLKQGELSFYHPLEEGEAASGVVRGLAETTDETAAVPYGQMKKYVAENGGGASQEYVDAELKKKFNKTGGVIDGDVVIGDGSLVEDLDGNVEERKVVLHYGKTMLGFANGTLEDATGIVDYEYGGGKIKGLEDAEADDEAVPYGQMQAEFEKVPTLKNGTAIPKDADLNTYTTIGNYYCFIDTYVDSLINRPVELFAHEFKMCVFSFGSLLHKGQEILDCETGVRFYREYAGLKWGAWKKSYNSLNKPTPEEIGALPDTGGTVTGDIVLNGGKLKGVTTAEDDDEAVPFGQMKQYVEENGGASVDELKANGQIGYTDTQEVEAIPEQTIEVAMNEDLGLPATFIVPGYDFNGVDKVRVLFDGVEYMCVPNTAGSIGNMAFTGGEDTGEPFAYTYLSLDEAGTTYVGLLLSEEGTHTFSAVAINEVVHPTSAKYQPVIKLTTVIPKSPEEGADVTQILSKAEHAELYDAARKGASVAISLIFEDAFSDQTIRRQRTIFFNLHANSDSDFLYTGCFMRGNSAELDVNLYKITVNPSEATLFAGGMASIPIKITG